MTVRKKKTLSSFFSPFQSCHFMGLLHDFNRLFLSSTAISLSL